MKSLDFWWDNRRSSYTIGYLAFEAIRFHALDSIFYPFSSVFCIKYIKYTKYLYIEYMFVFGELRSPAPKPHTQTPNVESIEELRKAGLSFVHHRDSCASLSFGRGFGLFYIVVIFSWVLNLIVIEYSEYCFALFVLATLLSSRVAAECSHSAWSNDLYAHVDVFVQHCLLCLQRIFRIIVIAYHPRIIVEIDCWFCSITSDPTGIPIKFVYCYSKWWLTVRRTRRWIDVVQSASDKSHRACER